MIHKVKNKKIIERYKLIIKLLNSSFSYAQIRETLNCGNNTIKVAKEWGIEQGLIDISKLNKKK